MYARFTADMHQQEEVAGSQAYLDEKVLISSKSCIQSYLISTTYTKASAPIASPQHPPTKAKPPIIKNVQYRKPVSLPTTPAKPSRPKPDAET